MKKLLVLGIGPSQADLIRVARDMGIEVHAVARDSNGKGKELVSHFKKIDIKDVETIKKYIIDENIDAVYSMGLESAIKPIAQISEDLGLPTFVSTTVYKNIENKGIWREKLAGTKGSVPFSLGSFTNDFKDWENYPAIMKPVDSSGQRGVIKVDSFEEIKESFDKVISYSKNKQVILEKYIDGPEVSVNSFMDDGKLIFALISDRHSYDEYPGGIVKAHQVPSRFLTDVIKQEIITLVENVNNKIGLKNGHIYFQLKIMNNHPYLIEFIPRFDGCHMWHLIEKATGINLVKATLEKLMYQEISDIDQYTNYEVNKMTTHFISDTPSTIVKKENYIIPNDNEYIEWYYSEGEKVKTVTGYLEKIGYYIKKG